MGTSFGTMLIDSHIHVGQFFDLYFAPSIIHKLMEQIEVDYYAVSSTTMCDENYPKVIDELQALIDLDGDKVLPIMWITPEGLKGNIAWFLESSIKWKCLKVHPFLHQHDWIPNGAQFSEVIDIARELRVPILIHTGDEDCCRSGMYESMIANNPDISFILAHGRPLNQALKLARTYSNAYADSAFMSIADMEQFVKAGIPNKLLWGTDMCIPKHFFPEKDMSAYYLQKLQAFKTVCSQEAFEKVICINATKLFSIQSIN